MSDVISIATLGLLRSAVTRRLQFGEKGGLTMRRTFDMLRGTTFRFDGVARKRDGAIVNLTGATLAWRMGAADKRATSFTLTEADGLTVTNAANGEYEIHIAPTRTATLNPGIYSHQFEVTEAAGDILAVMVGEMGIDRDLPG